MVLDSHLCRVPDSDLHIRCCQRRRLHLDHGSRIRGHESGSLKFVQEHLLNVGVLPTLCATDCLMTEGDEEHHDVLHSAHSITHHLYPPSHRRVHYDASLDRPPNALLPEQ